MTDGALPRRSAGLLIEVHPSGQPGRILLAVHDAGPVRLTRAEAMDVLAKAMVQVAQTEWPEGGADE